MTTAATAASLPTSQEDVAPRPGLLETGTKSFLFIGFHVATAVLVVVAGLPTWDLVLLCVVAYVVRMFGITGGFHRYFAHRSYKTGRLFQLFLGLLGTLSLQKGPLWWASHHRVHHRNSDQPGDPHSPIQDSLWYSHVGWILDPSTSETHWGQIKDLSKFPELRFLEHYLVWIGLFAPFCALFLFAWSFEAMVYGCFVSTVLLYHGTFTINSLCHVWGKRIYATTDMSRNNPILALITLGEGWHNNHHFYMTSANQGFRWYELDISFRVLWALEKLGIVWDVRRAPEEVVAGTLGGRSWLIADQQPEPKPAPARSPGAGALLPAPAPAAPVEDV